MNRDKFVIRLNEVVELFGEMIDHGKARNSPEYMLKISDLLVNIFCDGFEDCLDVLAEAFHSNPEYSMDFVEVIKFREEQSEVRPELRETMRDFMEDMLSDEE